MNLSPTCDFYGPVHLRKTFVTWGPQMFGSFPCMYVLGPSAYQMDDHYVDKVGIVTSFRAPDHLYHGGTSLGEDGKECRHSMSKAVRLQVSCDSQGTCAQPWTRCPDSDVQPTTVCTRAQALAAYPIDINDQRLTHISALSHSQRLNTGVSQQSLTVR
jgi:hypothetical protein